MSRPPFHGIFSSSMDKAVSALSGDWNDTDDKTPVEQPKIEQRVEPKTGQLAVDIFEQDSYYIIKAPLAGLKLADIDIEVNDNVLTIRGTRAQTDDIPDDQYYLRECFWGEFARSVTLPTVIDPKKVKATFNKESVLKVLIPKEEKIKIVKVND